MKSKKARKQRRSAAEAPLHRKQKMVSAPLNDKLRRELGRRSMSLREGDKVKVMRGDESGTESKVKGVNLSKGRVTLEDAKKEKPDGTEVHTEFHPSNLMIVKPDLSDRAREKIVERVGGEVEEELKEREEEVETEEEEKEEEEQKKSGFKCEICGKTYDSKQGLNIHKGKSHPEHTK